MKKRHSKPSGASYDGIFISSHLTDEALLRSIDGELSPAHAKEVLRHVQSCWACRSHKKQLEARISDLVAHHNSLADPYLPPSPGGRAIFLARLDAASAKMERPAPLVGWFFEIFAGLKSHRLAHIAGALLLISALIATYSLRTPPAVSASELLDRTAAYEASSLRGTEEPVIVQKLRITVGSKTIVHTVYHDIARNRTATRSEGIRAEEQVVQAAYMRSSLAWNSTLDVDSFRRWRSVQHFTKESVSRLGSNQLLLTTTFSNGPVREANLTIHIPDYHAVRENLRLADDSDLQITELSRAVVPFAKLGLNIFSTDVIAPLPTPQPVLRAIPPVEAASLVKETPTYAQLSRSEVQAERLLHSLGADLGEQVTISASKGQNVLITGVVRDANRKEQLDAALHDLPYLQVRLATVDEAAATAVAPEHSTTPESAETQTVMKATPPLLEEQLSSHFPDHDQRIAYVNQTLSIMQLASSRAWALKRLADRHPAATIAVLDDASRDDLKILLADHISALREDLRILQNQLHQLLSIPSTSSSANMPAERGTTAAQGSLSEDWRIQIGRVHSSTETVHEAVAVLLTSSQPGDQTDAKAIVSTLQTSMNQLQAELQKLDTQVGKENLN